MLLLTKVVAATKSMIQADARTTYSDIVNTLGIGMGTVKKILHDFLMVCKVSARWVPRLWHHDNASAHTAGATKLALAENNVEILPHSPYSPD